MTNQELAKVANEVRKGVVTAVHAASRDIRVDRSVLPTS